MSTLMQAVERLRDRGSLPASGPVSVKDLQQRFHASPPCSVRSLILKMFGGAAVRLPWAVILCRFKGLPGDAGIEQYIRSVFAPGTGGMVEYWRDVSLGAIDITGTQVFGWVELELKRENAGMGSTTREQLIDYAVSAAQRDGHEPISGFHSQIAILTHQWSKDGAPAGADWQDPVWGPFWIDGSADGRGRVLVPPLGRDGKTLAHEMGHGFGMQHDVGSDMMTHYADPCCIMSEQNSFRHAAWQFDFGPALCLPHLIQRGWMYTGRVYYDDGAWLAQSDGITLPLAPITDPGARANLGIKLFYKNSQTTWEYYLEYVKPNGWSQGIGKPFVFIRRMAPVTGIGETPIYLGSVEVPTKLGRKTEFIELSGNVRFQVERFDADGRILKVAAKKL